jgi:hypothetical protein
VKTWVKKLLALPSDAETGKRVWLLGLSVWLAMLSSASARTMLNTDDSAGFFTAVADKMLRNTFNFGVTNIPVETNGVFVYSPAVQRLLQLAANIYDATTTNFYPTVFRSVFNRDTSGNVFITGYQQVVGVNGANDPQLALPMDVSALPTGTSSNLNVYGVPWIIGAKKGFPNFNEFSMESIVQTTRKIQVTRTVTNLPPQAPFYQTNQMYVFSITNSIGVECWNSYTNSYSNTVQIVVNDNLSMTLTNNGLLAISSNYFISVSTTVTLWPGSVWAYNALDSSYPSPFVIPLQTNVTFMPASVYSFANQIFTPVNQSPPWETNIPLTVLPHFGLVTSNRFQLFMLDGSHVIDYVQFTGPNSLRDLNAELTNPDLNDQYGMWQTNLVGVRNQLNLSEGITVPDKVPDEDGGQWVRPQVSGIITIPQMQAYFQGLFVTNNIGHAFAWPADPANNPGATETNPSYGTQAPYTPTRAVVQYISWQANDPLVHYVASDLNYSGTEQQYGGPFTGITNNDRTAIPLLPDLGNVNDRYQPWGMTSQMAELANVSPSACDLTFKDPLVRKPDDWNFPTNGASIVNRLGQIHRGTPWQTIYLKASNILGEIKNGINVGTNTWMNWTGDFDPTDAAAMAPVRDRHVVSMLAALLNTNDLQSLFSVNNANPNAWLVCFDGLTALTNNLPDSRLHFGMFPPQFDTIVISSNSAQASIIASAIQTSRATQPNQYFRDVGDIMAIPQLTEQSPFLNWNDLIQQTNGISDEAYEEIPSQLLAFLRPDSVGAMIQVNGGWNIQFSGSDAFAYALQTSTNLIDWEIVSTNYPVQGNFSVPIPAVPNSQERFYRSVLLP